MKILFFTNDFSAENQAFAKQNGLTIRKVAAYYQNDAIENCDAVCGDAPEAYLARYPLYEPAGSEPNKLKGKKEEAEPETQDTGDE